MRSSKISPFATQHRRDRENIGPMPINFVISSEARKKKQFSLTKRWFICKRKGIARPQWIYGCLNNSNIWKQGREEMQKKTPNSMNELKTIIYRSSCPLGNHMPLLVVEHLCATYRFECMTLVRHLFLSKCITVPFWSIFISLSLLVELWALIWVYEWPRVTFMSFPSLQYNNLYNVMIS